ncbi:MAG: class II SORL domain-containing protein [Caldisericia bacterium]
MLDLNQFFQSGDWKGEKHVPYIEVNGEIKKGEFFNVHIFVGKEIPHPNTTEHHIKWISLYFHPEGEKFPYEIGKVEFNSHGESTQGPNTSTIYTNPKVIFSMKTEKNGKLIAFSYCNIHGLWSNSIDIKF